MNFYLHTLMPPGTTTVRGTQQEKNKCWLNIFYLPDIIQRLAQSRISKFSTELRRPQLFVSEEELGYLPRYNVISIKYSVLGTEILSGVTLRKVMPI